jgi:ABC-type lipoprotein release transport system permease subunit
VLRVALSELWRRRSRSLALLLGILAATTSFSVLTGTSESQRLEVRGTVEKRFRTAYDVVVRPRGARNPLERERGLVRPGVLTGLGGGISLKQWKAVLDTPGVEVAAPIATIGATLPDVVLPVDVTAAAAGRSPALFRVRVRRVTDRGLSAREDVPAYVWITDRDLAPAAGRGSIFDPGNYAPRLVVGDTLRPVCVSEWQSWAPRGPFDTGVEGGWRAGAVRGNVQCWSRRSGLDGEGFQGLPHGHAAALIPAALPFVLAAVDPEQEARLTGLDKSVLSGRYLRADDQPTGGQLPAVPVLLASRSYADETTIATVERLPDSAARRLPRARPNGQAALVGNELRRWLNSVPGRAIRRERFGPSAALDRLSGGAAVVTYWSVGETTYQDPGADRLVPKTVRNPLDVWRAEGSFGGYALAPLSADDRQFRRIRPHVGAAAAQVGQVFAGLRVVGRFDPVRLAGFADLDSAPLQTYRTPALRAADSRSRGLLGGRPLLPNGNIAGYLTQPPLLLTNLRSLSRFGAPHYKPPLARAPISAVRVRVAGVTGADELSRERVRRAAEAIAARTGLDVDLTIGSSPAPLTVALPAGEHGRPALELTEPWLAKGVGVAILDAIDRKSLILFALILVVCALFVTNAASAAVRARRSELGVLACLGWSTPRLFGVILLEVGTLGLLAGLAGAALALPLAAAVGVAPSPARAALAVPAAVGLALLAATGPALRAARSHPIAAVAPATLEAQRSWRPRRLNQLALINLVRVPGRALLGAASLAIGVGALTLLLAATIAFRGALSGTLLGHAVSIQIRTTDYVAVGAIILLGAAAVTDVLYLNITERATELATLHATGWDDRALARLISLEGLWLGSLGSLTGGLLGLLGSATFAGTLPAELLLTTIGAAIAGTLIAALASLVPAAALRRLPTVPLLAGE